MDLNINKDQNIQVKRTDIQVIRNANKYVLNINYLCMLK